MKEFDNVIGYESVKKELERTCDVLKNSEKYASLGVKMPHGLLLYGEPGVGKTTMAKSFIAALGWKTFLCRKTKSDGDFIEEIKKTFEEAKAQVPAIVFLDDLDKFANDDEDHTNSDAFVTVQSCIDEVLESSVFVLATANSTRNFPRSLLRSGRFDTMIELEAPRGKDAEEIIKHYLSQKKFIADIDTGIIAQIMNGRSCADLETVINEAGIEAGFTGKEQIDMESVIAACMRIIFEESSDSDSYSPTAQRRIACHEAGHAVVSEILEAGSVNLVSILLHNKRAGGIASSTQSPDYFAFTDYMDNRVMVLLGGRAASDIVFGELDPGATNDIHRAVDIVRRMISSYAGRGFAQYETDETGGELTNRVDVAVAFELERYYIQAKKILAENRRFLDALTDALLEKKTLLASEVQKIKAASVEAA